MYQEEVYAEMIQDPYFKDYRMEQIKDKELLDTVAAMKANGLAGYQENIWKEYLGEQ